VLSAGSCGGKNTNLSAGGMTNEFRKSNTTAKLAASQFNRRPAKAQDASSTKKTAWLLLPDCFIYNYYCAIIPL
jgi:hypothetical protein